MTTTGTHHGQRTQRRYWPRHVATAEQPLLEIVTQIDASQWWSRERLAEQQRRLFAAILNFARDNTEVYAERLRHSPTYASQDITDDLLRSLPCTRKAELQSEGQRYVAREHDPRFGDTRVYKTSGSVSIPLEVTWNRFANSFVTAKTFRYLQWHGADPARKMASLRVLPIGEDGNSAAVRGHNWYPLMPGGESVLQSATLPIAEQADWLRRENPTYLQTYPSNAYALVQHLAEHGIAVPDLERIDTYGEVLDDDLVPLARSALGAAVGDKYSAREVGEIATLCPASGLYHLQSETILTEVRKPDGTLAGEGEIGEVFVTNLHNTAMPIIRYAIEDYAEVGPQCPCGRGLPTLRRILGRTRNMLRLASGDRIWPRFSSETLSDAAPVRQTQLVQTAIDEITVFAVPLQELTERDETALCEEIWTRLPREFNLTIKTVDAIPRATSGKFEDFRCDIS